VRCHPFKLVYFLYRIKAIPRLKLPSFSAKHMQPQVVEVKSAGKVANALNNEKCKRILDHLYTHKDATETELSKALNIPLSTVHYNMKVLVDAKLVNTDTYSYSTRGKEVTHYKANKQPIVIVQEESQLSLLRAIVPAALVAAGAAAIYQITQRASPQTFDTMAAPAMDESTRSLAFESGEAVMMKAAPAVNDVAQSAFDPVSAFVLGVVSVLILSYVVLLAMRWYEKRR
jgi:DNA-binding transcriptional ArsR family regulator